MAKFPPSVRRIVSVVVASWLLTASFSLAQQTTPGQQPPTQNQQPSSQQQQEQPTETLKVNVNVVQLFFNVKDKHGALIPNLTKEDFEISEDKHTQTIKYLT